MSISRSKFDWRPALLWTTLVVVCTRIAWCHLSLFRMLEASDLYSFTAREPFTYRFLLALVLKPLGIDFVTCSTGLNFPIKSCADAVAMGIDSIALLAASVLLLFAVRTISAKGLVPIRLPVLCVPVFLWAVTFNYVAVPNSSIYYAYDFPELMFFGITVWLAVSGKGRVHLLLPLLLFVASFNKETSLFMIPVFVVYAACAGTLTRLSLVAAAVSVVAVFAAKYISYSYVVTVLRPDIAADPTVYENQVVKNLRQMANPMAWFAWIGVFGGGAFLLALPGASVKNLNRGVAVILIGWLGVLFLVGLPREMRLFGPMIFVIILPLMLKIESLLFDAVARIGGPAVQPANHSAASAN